MGKSTPIGYRFASPEARVIELVGDPAELAAKYVRKYDAARRDAEDWQMRAHRAEALLAEMRSIDPGDSCAMDGCSVKPMDDFPIRVCRDHAYVVSREYLDWEMRNVSHYPSRQEVAAEQMRTHLVYYIRLQDRIKIGTTTNLVRRMSSFYAQPEQLLAIEPGGLYRERERHQQFAHLRHGRTELFDQGSDLLEHVREVVAMFGDPMRFLQADAA